MAISRNNALDKRLRAFFERMAENRQTIFPYISDYNIGRKSGHMMLLKITIPMTDELVTQILDLPDHLEE